MPSSAFGPLVEPGWPSSLPRPPDLGERFLSAWQTGNAIRLRKEELEGKLAEYALRDKQRDITDALKEREFQFKMNQAASHEDYLNRVLGIREESQNLQRERLNKALDLQQSKTADKEEGMQALIDAGDAGSNPLNPDFVNTRMSVLRLHPNVGYNTSQVFNEVNAASRAAKTNLANEQAHELKKVGQSDLGISNFQDANMFIDWERRSYEGFRTMPTKEEAARNIKPGDPSLPVLPAYDPTRPGKVARSQKDSRGITRTLELDPKTGEFVPANKRVFYFPGNSSQPNPIFAAIDNNRVTQLHDKFKKFQDDDMALPPEINMGSSNNLPVRINNPKDYEKLPVGTAYYWVDPDTGKKIFYPAKGN